MVKLRTGRKLLNLNKALNVQETSIHAQTEDPKGLDL